MVERSVQRARWHCTSRLGRRGMCSCSFVCLFLLLLLEVAPVGHRSEGADLLSPHHTVLCVSFKDNLDPRRRAIPVIFNVEIPTLLVIVSFFFVSSAVAYENNDPLVRHQ